MRHFFSYVRRARGAWLAHLVVCFLAVGLPLLFGASAMAQEVRDLPNIFTPNGDGTNDHFVLEGTEPITLMVFNRNGVLVYQTRGLLIRWDGRDRVGRELADGVYFYKVEDPTGVYKKKRGTVCISRTAMRKAE